MTNSSSKVLGTGKGWGSARYVVVGNIKFSFHFILYWPCKLRKILQRGNNAFYTLGRNERCTQKLLAASLKVS